MDSVLLSWENELFTINVRGPLGTVAEALDPIAPEMYTQFHIRIKKYNI